MYTYTRALELFSHFNAHLIECFKKFNVHFHLIFKQQIGMCDSLENGHRQQSMKHRHRRQLVNIDDTNSTSRHLSVSTNCLPARRLLNV